MTEKMWGEKTLKFKHTLTTKNNAQAYSRLVTIVTNSPCSNRVWDQLGGLVWICLSEIPEVPGLPGTSMPKHGIGCLDILVGLLKWFSKSFSQQIHDVSQTSYVGAVRHHSWKKKNLLPLLLSFMAVLFKGTVSKVVAYFRPLVLFL